MELNDGETDRINEEVMFQADRTDGNRFSITFKAKERDDPPFGAPNYNDLNRGDTKTHTFGSTGWNNLGPGGNTPITVDFSKAQSCRVSNSPTPWGFRRIRLC